MLLQVLERQKLLETADGMGGNSGNRQAADQKVDNDSGGDGDGGDGGGDGGIDVRLVLKQVTFQADKDCVDDHREEWRQQLVETVKLVGNEHYIDHLER